MGLCLFNTLGRKAEPFVPIAEGKAGFYGCGPTVYNYAHLGNLRAYVLHDILSRTLERAGFDVTHVMNITDVGHLSGDNDEGEDKMLRSAGERGKSVLEIAEMYTGAFFADTERLNIRRPRVVCRATEHIPEMIDLIRRIEDRGYTYSAGGNLYFDVGKFPRYGDLALLRPGALRSSGRIGEDLNKRNAQDFVLWFTKSKFANQALVWDSPWGRGYPGWHIECSAMSLKYLGEQFDIHAGGVDHIPVHHSNEIAQTEAATGIHPWVRYWVHNEFLLLDKGKMSKSGGDFLILDKLVEAGYDPLDYRYFLLGGHYRSQLQFSFEALEGARNARKSLREKLRVLAEKAPPEKAPGGRPPEGRAAASLAAFDRAMEDDLSTPRALAEMWGLLRDAEAPPAEVLAAVLDMDRVLGLGLAEEAVGGRVGGAERAEIEALVAERAAAKKAGDFAKADGIRGRLKERGIVLEDGPGGTLWRRRQ